MQQSVERILRQWWLVFLICILGGGIGWFLNDVQPPLYEAEARFHLYIDTVRTGPIDRLDTDVITQTAGWVMSTPEILDQVIAQAGLQGIQINREKILEIFTPEQRGELWILRVRFPDPQAAATLANLWAEIGGQRLTETLQHAERAESYRRFMESLQGCLMQAYVTEPATAQCAANNAQTIQNDLASTGQLYLQEKGAARGVSQAIELSFESAAAMPTAPVRHQRSTFILAGALIGLLLGGWGISAGLADRAQKALRGR